MERHSSELSTELKKQRVDVASNAAAQEAAMQATNVRESEQLPS